MIGLGLIGEMADLVNLTNKLYLEDGIKLAEQGHLVEFHERLKNNIHAIKRRELIQELKKLDLLAWEKVLKVLAKTRDESSIVLNLFGNRMSPNQLESILQFRETISGMIDVFSAFRYEGERH
jgi:hypothetical protein